MAVKFKKNTVHMNVKGGDKSDAAHDIAHKVGEALTKGGGARGYLAVCFSIPYRLVLHLAALRNEKLLLMVEFERNW